MSWFESQIDRDPQPVTIEMIREALERVHPPPPYLVRKELYDSYRACCEDDGLDA